MARAGSAADRPDPGKGADAPTVAGAWWDEPFAAYAQARWAESLGGTWDPLRDAWPKHS